MKPVDEENALEADKRDDIDEEQATDEEPAKAAPLELDPEDEPNHSVAPGKSRWRRFRDWSGTKKGKITLAGIGLLAVGVGTIAATELRYPVANTFMKNEAEITVRDADTKQLLTDADITLGGRSAKTDKAGVAKLTKLPLGPGTITVTKKAYKEYRGAVHVPIFGEPKVGVITLKSAGIAIPFEIVDKISGKPVDGAEVAVDDIKAVSKDGKGNIILLPNDSGAETVTVTKDGYLPATAAFTIKDKAEAVKVSLIPSGKVYFLSNRSGKLDLYESNLDGSESKVILAATGSETAETGILPSVKHSEKLAILSSREGKRRENGQLRSALFMFDTKSRELRKIEDDVTFYDFRGWTGDYLVYQKPDQAGNCRDVKSFNVATGKTTTLVAGVNPVCPTINTVYYDTVFYSIYNYNNDSSNQGLYIVKANGTGGRRLSNNPANSLNRSAKHSVLANYYNNALPKPQIWYNVNLESFAIASSDNGPSLETYRSYVDSPGDKYSTFIEQRDGKSDIYLTDEEGGNERRLTNLGTVNQFVQWQGDKYIVFSSTRSGENALYVVAVDGGEPQKVADFYQGNNRSYGGGYNPNYY